MATAISSADAPSPPTTTPASLSAATTVMVKPAIQTSCGATLRLSIASVGLPMGGRLARAGIRIIRGRRLMEGLQVGVDFVRLLEGEGRDGMVGVRWVEDRGRLVEVEVCELFNITFLETDFIYAHFMYTP